MRSLLSMSAWSKEARGLAIAMFVRGSKLTESDMLPPIPSRASTGLGGNYGRE
jgi:hypothetical protein